MENWINQNIITMNFKISYAITACNEHKELNELLEFLLGHKRDEDEVVVQTDSDSSTKEVSKVISSHNLKENKFPLNKDFSSFKNNLKKLCSGDYIFQIDADELPSEAIVCNLHKILESNLDIDLFLVPRINLVQGITDEHIKKWNWKTNEQGWVNWPDYQYRIFKNTFNIKWRNKVHEQLIGAQTGTQLPQTIQYALTHIKDIKRQESQNEFYEDMT